MGRRPHSIGYLLAAAVLAAGAAQAQAAWAQSDPFGSLHGSPGKAPPSTVGSTRIETAVGRSYAGSQEKGVVSLAQIAFLPKTVAPFPIELDGAGEKYLAGRPRIAVATYGLGVVRSQSVTASAAGQGSDITPRRTTVATYLEGVPDELSAQLAEEAYQDLVSRLKDAGFEVVPAAEVAAAPHMQSLGYPSPVLEGKEGGGTWATYAPKAAPLIKGYANERGLATLSASGSLIAFGKVSQELDAVVLVPRLMLNNVGMGGTGHRNYVGSASASAEVRFWITPASRTDFIWGNERGGSMPGGFAVKTYGTDEPFAVMVKAGDRSDSKALHNALAEAGFGSLYRQSLVYAVEADPGRFAALSRAAFKGYNAALVEEIRRARNP